MKLGLASTDRGRRITVTGRVEATEEEVWRVLTETKYWSEWGPPVTDVDYSSRTIESGTEGRVQAFGFLWVPFRIESVDGGVWTWKAWGITPPADGHRVEPVDDEACLVTLELPLWAPWYLIVCWLALRNIQKLVEN